jgi:hypothetical protein
MNIVRSIRYAQLLSLSRRTSRRIALTAVGGLLFAASGSAFAQREAPDGAHAQDNRSAAMGTKPDPASSTVHESNAPQAKDAKGGAKRGATTGESGKPDGAGGFSNGLYGTGAGSNK